MILLSCIGCVGSWFTYGASVFGCVGTWVSWVIKLPGSSMLCDFIKFSELVNKFLE